MKTKRSTPTAPLSKWIAITVASVLLIGGGGAVLNGCVIQPLRTGEIINRYHENEQNHFFAIETRVRETRYSRESDPFIFWVIVGGGSALSLILLWPGIANLIGGFKRSPGIAIGYIPPHPGLIGGKCACPHCENNIAFDPEHFGMEIECPHCGERLQLSENILVDGNDPTESSHSEQLPPILIAPAVLLLSFLFALLFPSIRYWFAGLAAIIVGIVIEVQYRSEKGRGRFVPGRVVEHEHIRQWSWERHKYYGGWWALIEYEDGNRTGTFWSASRFGKRLLPRIGKRVEVLIVDGEATTVRLGGAFRAFFVSAFVLGGILIIAQFKMGEKIAQTRDVTVVSSQTTRIEPSAWTLNNLPQLLGESEKHPEDTIAAMTLAALQLWFGQEAEYEQTRNRMLEWAANTQNMQVAERVAKLSNLRPHGDERLRNMSVSLVNTALMRAGPRTDPWVTMAAGMYSYRTGYYEQANRSFATAVEAAPTGGARVYVGGTCGFYHAMSLFRLGRQEEARRLYQTTLVNMPPLPTDEQNPLANGATHDDLILWLASREAKALLGE